MREAIDTEELIARIERGEQTEALLEAVAAALGWQRRIRTSLGFNGRTPGRSGWVGPQPPYDWRPRLPRLLGPRKRAQTIERLASLSTQEAGDGPE